MVDVTNLSQAADKFERRASASGQDYEAGVSEVSDAEWADATDAQEDVWATAVQEAASQGRFGDGVRNTTKSWQNRSLEVGSGRFTTGAGSAGPQWQAGFSRYADALEGLTLDPRGPRGSSVNQQRSIAVQERLHNERQQG